MGVPPVLHSKTLQYAAELLGGENKLAARLHVTLAELECWMRDEEEPPPAVVASTIDVIRDVAIARFRGESGR